MTLQNVDIVHIQSLERSLDRVKDVLAAQSLLVDKGVVRKRLAIRLDSVEYLRVSWIQPMTPMHTFVRITTLSREHCD